MGSRGCPLMGIMAIINLPVIVILGNTALKCLDDYLAQKKGRQESVLQG